MKKMIDSKLTGKRLIKYTEALRLINAHVKSFGRERVTLDDADGRVLAESIWADRDYPPANKAAVNGYAIRKADWEEGVRVYTVQQLISAGQHQKQPLSSGACFKIMAGAAVPASADVLVRMEDTLEYEGGVVLKEVPVNPRQYMVLKGEDAAARDMLMPVHTPCGPAMLALLATVGKKTVLVEKLPRVALLTTGNEVVSVGALVSDVQVRNSNKYLLQSLLKKWKIKPDLCEHTPDNKTKLTASLRKAMYHDIVILNGGITAAEEEYVPQVLEELGVEKVFHKVAVKPGEPVYFGRLPHGGVIFALPGNPFSCLVTFTLFVENYLYHCFGLNQPLFQATLLEQHDKEGPFTEFFPISIDSFASGVRPLALSGAGDLRAGIGAHALGIHPAAHEELRKGAVISVIPFNNSLL